MAQFQFSIVTAVYNVARYLDEFIESLEGQTFPREQFEVIAVDDGSTDESLAMLRAWEERRPGLVTVITKENGGQATARNLGMESARGQWITFTDPDDILATDYLAEVTAFLDEHPETALVATNRLILNDFTGEVADTHPLRRNFRHGNRLRKISHYPDHFHNMAAAAFFPLKELNRQRLQFDPLVRPNFEDGHFISRYLLVMPDAAIGFVATARYLYRQRQDSSSALQSSVYDKRRYTDVLRYGFLDLLQLGAQRAKSGELPPEWLQNLIVYELSWYFSLQETQSGAVGAGLGPVADEFHELVAQILRYLSKDVIAGFTVRSMKSEWTDILLHGYEVEPWHSPRAHVLKFDWHQGLVRIVYRFTGDPPFEELLSGGRVVPPAHSKIRELEYHGRVLVRDRVVWLSAHRSIRIRLAGRPLDLQFSVPRPTYTLQPGQVQSRLGVPRRGGGRGGREPLWNRIVRRLSRTRIVRRFFANAWVLMDRITDAGDNGERLFHYLRKERPDINAWFVVERGTADWHRLRAAWQGRVIAHGSFRWKLLMLNCRHLISSHVDAPIVRPIGLSPHEMRWRFTFLQHGVTKDDLSAWFNPKPIDLLITSTPAEHASIAGDGPYTATTKEVKLTGFPRFDRLLEVDRAVRKDQRNLVLVVPTWRAHLAPLMRQGWHRRSVDPSLFTSEFLTNWMALLTSERLADTCSRHGATLAFLPHPNLQPALPQMDLPAHVRPMTFHDNDVQELFARSAVVVTDYSSVAFDAAYINRPVVYYQFDAERIGGAGVGRRGYFDYERDGFGPVARTYDGAVGAIADALEDPLAVRAAYLSRIEAAFSVRDGKCCERVVREIKQSTRRPRGDAAESVLTPRRPDR